MEKRYVIPDGMLQAAERYVNSTDGKGFAKPILYAAIRWLAEQDMVPTQDQINKMGDAYSANHPPVPRHSSLEFYCPEWVKIMFLAPEPEVPEAIKDLWEQAPKGGTAQEAILESYRRGQQNILARLVK